MMTHRSLFNCQKWEAKFKAAMKAWIFGWETLFAGTIDVDGTISSEEVLIKVCSEFSGKFPKFPFQ